MTAPSLPRRVTKSAEARRTDILDAAVRLFHEAGYDATTVQHIAAAAGVAAGTVYLYFPSKEHVLLTLHADFHAGIEAAMQSTFEAVWEHVQAEDPPNALELTVDAMVDTVVAFVREHPATSSVICRFAPRLTPEAAEAHGAHDAAYLVAALEFGVAQGKIEVSDPQMAAHLLEAALSGPLSRMVVEGDSAEVDRLAAQAKEFFVKALAPQR